MGKQRYPGKGLLVEYSTDGTNYDKLELMRSATLPGSESEEVDLTGLEENWPVIIPGMVSPSRFECNHVWDPNYAKDSALRTHKNAATDLYWRVTFTNGTKTAIATFRGRVSAMVPSEVSGNTGLFRTVRVAVSAEPAFSEGTPGS